jgi:hypothetical protein
MGRISLHRAILGATAGLVLGASVPAEAQTSSKNPPPAATTIDRTKHPAERASGVIVKVEPLGKRDAKGPRSYRLTINTAAVWRDWARDQATRSGAGSTGRAAAEGNKSIATRGEPATKDTMVAVDVGPEALVEGRFRTLDDETSKGGRTPAEARAEEKDPAARRRFAAKPAAISAAELKPGLFVEVDFHRAAKSENRASSVAVIRPVSTELPRSK